MFKPDPKPPKKHPKNPPQNYSHLSPLLPPNLRIIFPKSPSVTTDKIEKSLFFPTFLNINDVK